MDSKIELQNQIQQQAEIEHLKRGRRSITVLPTGTGKSYYAIKRLESVLNDNSEAKFLFIGARQVYSLNFEQEIRKFGKEHLLTHITFICTKSALKHTNLHYDAVVLDEIHKETKQVVKFLNLFFKQNPQSEIIGLTATPKHPDHRKYDPLYTILPISFEHYAEEAIENKLSNDYRILLIYHDLDARNTIHVKTKKYDFWTSEVKSIERAYTKYKAADFSQSKGFPIEIMTLKSLLKNCNSKVEATKRVIDKLKSDSNKILVYAGSIKNTTQFNYPTFHSGLSKEVRESNLTTFQEAKSGVLVDCAGLKESVNIMNLNYSIVTHLDASASSAEQMRGRLQRLSIGETGTMIILIANDSIEPLWAAKALSGFDQKKIERITLEEFLKN